FDGTVPIIHAGSIKDWVVQKTFQPKAFFTFAEPIDFKTLIIRSVSSNTGNNILGIIELDSIPKVKLQPDILKVYLDGYYDSDGQLLFNIQLYKIMYVYYYKKQFLVDTYKLTYIQIYNTSDTIKEPHIDVKELQSSQQKQLGGKSVLVNGLVAT